MMRKYWDSGCNTGQFAWNLRERWTMNGIPRDHHVAKEIVCDKMLIFAPFEAKQWRIDLDDKCLFDNDYRPYRMTMFRTETRS